ncbi:hypothetical protein SAMN05216266_1203 [Amycolatopsis marina]|uniref:Uncharacterized protein n=1 Tax=Amycolatopsis marina TaxID=490629 RepID=A0A1I1C2F1_9PSEU|nr:hypothetical protein [Amycolatopsis marina]SFB56517.1 hypothetical protein SAMN05216266_1203 [Amycolatopsis marina]
MYTWLWRHLPGPLGVRVATAAVLALGAVALLMLVVFPAVEPMLPFNDVAVEESVVDQVER